MDSNSPPENTYVADSESPMEMARLINLDRAATKRMGGSLAGLPDLPPGARVIDLACGPGGWVLDVALAHPDFEVCGVDISTSMIEYANARASSQGLKSASFGVMNITGPLDFDDASFDLVNARFLVGVLKRDAWQPFLAECTRILRPGGILRLTDSNDPGLTNSPALEQLSSLLLQGMWHADYGFSPNGRTWSMSPVLPKLLSRAGYRDVHVSSFDTDYSADTEHWADFYHISEISYRQVKPLLVALNLVTSEEFEHLYQQAIIDMHTSDFICRTHAFSVWGVSSSKE